MNMIDMTAALKSWIEKGQYNFKQHCYHQQQYYIAIAHYYESQRVSKLAEEGVYGKELAWLKSANSILSSIANSKSKLIPTLASHRKQLIRKLSPRLKEATKDNNDIYHDPVPSISSMKSIGEDKTYQLLNGNLKLILLRIHLKIWCQKQLQRKQIN